MGKYLGIDAGRKRIGLALSDETATIASPWKTVNHEELERELKSLIDQGGLVGIVLGLPRDLMNRETDGTAVAREIEKRLQRKFPQLPIHLEDERFSSQIAFQSMLDAAVPKQKRRDKSLIDKASATIILQSFLDRLSRQK